MNNDNLARVLTHAERLLRAIAPHELDGTPVYLVGASDAPWLDMRGTLGMVNVTLDLRLRPVLESQGRWQGRGFCTVLNLDWFAEHRAGFGRLLTSVVGTVVHEFAHWLCLPADICNVLPAELPPELAATICQRQLAMDRATFTATTPAEIEMSKWVTHSGPWLRALCHLSYRAMTAPPTLRIKFSDGDLLSCDGYGLSPFGRYERALAPETVRRRDESIRSILMTDAPMAFAQLWDRDTGGSWR